MLPMADSPISPADWRYILRNLRTARAAALRVNATILGWRDMNGWKYCTLELSATRRNEASHTFLKCSDALQQLEYALYHAEGQAKYGHDGWQAELDRRESAQEG